MTPNFKTQFIKIYRFAILGIFILFPILLIVLPADYFDHGQSISLFELFGAENYYSKGMTRAVMHLIHFDFQIAWSYNKLAFLAFPLVSLIWLHYFLRHLYKVNRAYFLEVELGKKINLLISRYLRFTSKFNFRSKLKKEPR